jgi:L-rhamnose mutarotase
MYSIALAMTLKPGAWEGYKSAHDALWPEIARSMSDSGVSMAIHRDGPRLFLFATAPTEADWQKSRQAPDLARWDAQMTRFLETTPDGRIAFTLLEKAFGFGAFA